MSKLKATPDWLATQSAGKPVGVDREAKIIHGYVVAELGAFKTPGGVGSEPGRRRN